MTTPNLTPISVLAAELESTLASAPVSISTPISTTVSLPTLTSVPLPIPDEKDKIIEKILNSQEKLIIIDGGPGTGKTTLINMLLQRINQTETYRKRYPDIILTATTGKAAMIISRITGQPATTVHSAFKLLPGKKLDFPVSANFQNKNQLTMLDEASMLTIDVLAEVIKRTFMTNDVYINKMNKYKKIILIGDAGQLPPVGIGFPLKDLIDSKMIKTFLLRTVYRTGAGSRISLNATRLKAHKNFIIPANGMENIDSDICFYEANDYSETIKKLATVYNDLKKKLNLSNSELINDVQIICPQNISKFGTKELNKINRKMFLRCGAIKESGYFATGEKVIQIKTIKKRNPPQNNAEVHGINNGEIGIVKGLVKIGGKLPIVQFSKNKIIRYDYEMIKLLSSAFALTVHKYQGSENRFIIFICSSSNAFMLRHSLFYTALTRAKEKFIIIGERKALARAIKNKTSFKKTSIFLELLLSKEKARNKRSEK